MKRTIFFIVELFFSYTLFSQASFSVTDSFPFTQNGLQMGYTILKEGEKEVGSKGNFSRYVISFYITNTTNEAKVFLHKQGWSLLNDISPTLARFDCANATGARLTNKSATLDAKPCNVIAKVDDKDCQNNKTVQNQRFVDIGYWIQAGETISTKVIMITPLNELPKVTVTPMPNQSAVVGSIQNTASPFANNSSNPVFYKIKNFWKNTYLNNQNGPVACTDITDGWWSAQWELMPVNGTNYYLLKNRWKNNFISDESNAMSSMNSQSNNAMWLLEPVPNSNLYKIKNVADNTYLNIETGPLRSSYIQDDAWSARWILEPQQ